MGRVAGLVAVVLVVVLAGCGGETKEPPAPSPPSVTSSAPAAPASEEPPDEQPGTTESPDRPGALSEQGQAYLDEAIGTELGALEAAPPGTVGDRRTTLDQLPGEPDQVVAALKDYQWLSPEAAALYRKATAS